MKLTRIGRPKWQMQGEKEIRKYSCKKQFVAVKSGNLASQYETSRGSLRTTSIVVLFGIWYRPLESICLLNRSHVILYFIDYNSGIFVEGWMIISNKSYASIISWFLVVQRKVRFVYLRQITVSLRCFSYNNFRSVLTRFAQSICCLAI